MKVAMLILALYGQPQDGDWRVTFRVMVPPAHCEAERLKFNQPGSRYRVVCDEHQKFVSACMAGTLVATKP